MYRMLVLVVLVVCACAEVNGHVPKEPAVPLCLPKAKNEKTLELQKEGLDVLKKVGDDPVIVICIAGPARTGKSYFLTKLSDNANFEVGHGMKGKTTGIWISANAEMIEKEGVKARLVLLDAEGIGSITGDKETMDKWDTSIVSLCTLTSSVLIYNKNKIPSHYDLQKLHFFSMFGGTMGSDDINFRSTETLIWLVRDNTITLGEQPNWTTFFEKEVLEDTDDVAPSEIIAGIKKMFPKFYAIALPPPSVNSTVCENLDNDEFKDELNPFLTEVSNAAKQITSMAAIKHVVGERMTGNKCLNLLTDWVDKINEEGSKFSWKIGFETALRFRCEGLIKECKGKFKDEVNRINLRQEKDCMKRMRDIEKNALICFETLHIAINEVRDEFLEKLKSSIADEKSEVLKKWAKIQFEKLIEEYKSKTDLIDLQKRETKLIFLMKTIEDIDKETIYQFELRNIAEADPLAEYCEKVKSELEKTKNVIVNKWMEYHFKIFPEIHKEKLDDIDLGQTLDTVESRIAKIERETLNHFKINDMDQWPILQAKLDALKLELYNHKGIIINMWKRQHKWDGLNVAAGTTVAGAAAAGGMGMLLGGPPGAVVAAATSALTGGLWAAYEYVTADAD